MTVIADKNRRGLMGPNHVRRLARVESIVKDPLAFTDVEPTLDLDFTDIKGAPFTGNLVRATVGGYRMNNKGVLVPTVANEPVIDFDSAGKPIGTAFYGAYTNLLLRSEEFDNASWSKTNVTVTANSTVAPDGTTTMDALDATVAGGVVAQTVSMSAGSTTVHSVSLFLKQGTAVTTTVYATFFSGGTSNNTIATITWATKAVALTGTSNDRSYILEDCGGGIYRLTVSGSNSGGANTQIQCGIYPAGIFGGATGTVVAWGAQLTATAFSVPYVPTTSAAVVRNADVFTITGTDFTDFYNQTEGTIFADINVYRGTISYPRLVQLDDGSDNNRNTIYFDVPLNKVTAATFVSNANVASILFDSAQGNAIKIAYSYKTNAFNAAMNGVAGTPDVSGAVPSGLNRLWIGNNERNEHIRRLIYFPKALDAATLQRMTA